MAMHLRLGLAELAGERGEPHRLSGRGQRLDDLPGDHDGLNELGIARALLILGTIQRVGFHGSAFSMEAALGRAHESSPPRRLFLTILCAGYPITASRPFISL